MPFVKGHTIGRMFKGRKLSEEHRKKIGKANYKGDEAGYHAIHLWVVKQKGRAPHCVDCGEEKSKYEWSNVDHQYRRVLDDYVARCTKCHRAYDRDILKIKVGR